MDAEDYGRPVEDDDPSAFEGDWELHRLQEKYEAGAARARRWSGSRVGLRLPDDFRQVEDLGADPFQVRKAEAMAHKGLHSKAKRQAWCGVLGMRLECTNTECRGRYYHPFRCRNRYCPTCGPKAYRELMARYRNLGEVAERLVPGWSGDPHYKRRDEVVAKLDITTKNLGCMPRADEVRLFNRLVRRLFQKLCLPTGEWGVVWCDEFGGHNTNLHAHGVYVGPFLRQRSLSETWRAVTQGTVFEGSYIVSIKRARSFPAALAHALKYPAKHLAHSDPERLAELELAFHKVRRVHTMGAFYGVKTNDQSVWQGPSCPSCGSALRDLPGGWDYVRALRAEGLVSVEEATRQVGRRRVLRGPPRAALL